MRVEVAEAARHELETARMELLARIKRSEPPEGVDFIGFEPVVGSDTCPRVEIALPGADETPADAQTWADTTQRRYGKRRVVVRHFEIEDF